MITDKVPTFYFLITLFASVVLVLYSILWTSLSCSPPYVKSLFQLQETRPMSERTDHSIATTNTKSKVPLNPQSKDLKDIFHNGFDIDASDKEKTVTSTFKTTIHAKVSLQTNGNYVEETVWEVEKGVIYRPVKTNGSFLEQHRVPQINNFESYLPFNETMFFPNPAKHKTISLTPRKIILWYIQPGYYLPMDKPENLPVCPDFPCLVTTNRAYANQSAMMIFNGQKGKTEKPPPRAFPEQIFLFHNQESWTSDAFRGTKYYTAAWRSVFNWTMSYRSDATIPAFYGLVREHPNPPTKNYTSILSKKNRTVAWLVSNCGAASQRDKYVSELKKYIDVNVYGRCGTLKCERKKDEECRKSIAESYKFYLAFENQFCRDYLSEKFFCNMPLDIVTIARGSNDYRKHAAPGTFINTADFESPRQLAERLIFLDKNDDEYIKILREKDRFIYLYEAYPHPMKNGRIPYVHYHYEAVPICQACQKLWNIESNRGTVPDIQEWLNKQDCRKADDF